VNIHDSCSLRVVGLKIGNHQLDYVGDLHSELHPGILLLLCSFAICEIALHYYCSLDVSTIMPTVLVRSLTSILHSSSNIFFGGSMHSMSAFLVYYAALPLEVTLRMLSVCLSVCSVPTVNSRTKNFRKPQIITTKAARVTRNQA